MISGRLELSDLDRQSLKRRGFDDEDIARAQAFGRPCVALSDYVDIDGGVITPKGQGKLLSAFSEECRVLLTRGRPTQQRKNGEWYVPTITVHPDEVKPSGRKG